MKKGFTLVETIAVIALVALLGIITVPSVSKLILDNTKKLDKISLNGLMRAAKILFIEGEVEDNDDSFYMTNLLHHGDEFVEAFCVSVNSDLLEFTGKENFSSGKICIESHLIGLTEYKSIFYFDDVISNEYCMQGFAKIDDFSELVIKKGKCPSTYNKDN